MVDVLVRKSLLACEQENLKRIVLTGGVAANGYLRNALHEAAQAKGIACYVPEPIHCTDNAAMIACAGYHRYQNCAPQPGEALTMDAHANFSVESDGR